MAKSQIVGVILRQPISKDGKRLAAVRRASHDDIAVNWNPLFVRHGRYEPRRFGIERMSCYGKTEVRRLDASDFLP